MVKKIDSRINDKDWEINLKIYDMRVNGELKLFEIAEKLFPEEYSKEIKEYEGYGKILRKKEELFNKLIKKYGDDDDAVDKAYALAYGSKPGKKTNKVIQMIWDRFMSAKRKVEGGYRYLN